MTTTAFHRIRRGGKESHGRATNVGQLINRRKRYAPHLRRSLSENLVLRQTADDGTDAISDVQASRAVRRTHEFVDAIRLAESGKR